jgi:hypothetical protein
MQLIDARFVDQGVHEPLAGRHFKRSDIFNGELWHER